MILVEIVLVMFIIAFQMYENMVLFYKNRKLMEENRQLKLQILGKQEK